jgi:hypothetical protein
MNRRTSVRVHEAQKDESHMKQTAMLTTVSLLTILLTTIHLTGDILFRMAPAGLVNLVVVFIFVVSVTHRFLRRGALLATLKPIELLE